MFADVRPLDPSRVVLGQYDGYRDEDDVDEDSDVETFVALEAFVDNDRWRGVPFHLRTGKAMAETRRTVTLRFREPESSVFGTGLSPDELVLELTDEAQVHVDLLGKRPGPEMALAPATMRLDLGEELPHDEPLEAYERLLLDVLDGGWRLGREDSDGECAAAVPIADHGLVGDLRTAALVATDGTIDWFCPGRFDAPSVFASILDPGAESWRLRPDDEDARSQRGAAGA